MREIKFRAMTKYQMFPHLEKMVYGTGILEDGVNTWLISNTPNKAIHFGQIKEIIHPETVGQYTGLKDYNGKDICEGDIVIRSCVRDNGIQNYGKIHFGKTRFKISWEYNGVFSSSFTINFRLSAFEEKDLEIVGNIYENPELLKGEIKCKNCKGVYPVDMIVKGYCDNCISKGQEVEMIREDD